MESYQRCQRPQQQQSHHPLHLDELPLAMAYVPWQRWGKLYHPEKALQAGTIFQELDLPFLGKGGCKR